MNSLDDRDSPRWFHKPTPPSPQRSASTGSSTRLSSVEIASPPGTVTAIGPLDYLTRAVRPHGDGNPQEQVETGHRSGQDAGRPHPRRDYSPAASFFASSTSLAFGASPSTTKTMFPLRATTTPPARFPV